MSSLKKITRRLAKLLRRVVSRPVLKKLPSPAWRFLRNRKGLVIGLGVILFLLPVVYFVSLRPRGAEAGWFNDQWLYRKPIAITNAGSDQTDFQINLSIGTSALVNAGKMQSDCDDIKITDVNGNLLPYWIEENNPGCNAATDTNIWVKASSLPTSGATLYIYYGNPSASSSQNGNDVFEFFDDFSGASLDTNKWTSLESPSISAGVLSLNSASTKEGIRGLVALETQNSILGFRTSISSVTLSIARNGFSNTTDLSSNFYADDDAYVWNGSGTNDEQYCSNNEGATNADAGNTEDTNYHVYELRWSSSNTKFYKDDNLEHTASVQFADETSYPRFEHQASGGALTNNVDWIYVRSYAATEPSAGTPGTEEESEGLVAYWAFDEGYGTTANDSTQNTYHATLGGTALPTWKNEDECVSGKCLYFNGYDTANNSKVTLAETSTTKTNILDDVTTSLWIKPTSNYYDTGEAVLRNGQGADLVYSVFYDPVNQRPYFHWYDGSFKAEYANSNTVPLNKWSHIAITRSGTTLKFYINGVLDTTATVTAPTVAASQLCIGQTNNDAVAQDYTGFIDEVKIYPYARTATQIKTDYASAGSAHGNAAVLGASKDQGDFLSEGLVGYWKMDANVGTTIPDYSGNGNTGTFGTGDSAPGWTSGMYGVGLSFDGSNDYVNVNNTILDNAITFSISAWVKTTDDGNYKRIVHKGAFGGASGNGFWFRKQSTNVAAFYGGCTATGTSSINDGAWHYITGVKTSSQSQIYVNGILQDACDDTTTLTTTNNLQISGYNNGVGEI